MAERSLADHIAELKYLSRSLQDVNTRILQRLANGEGTASVEERNQLGYELLIFTGRVEERLRTLSPRLEALLRDVPEVAPMPCLGCEDEACPCTAPPEPDCSKYGDSGTLGTSAGPCDCAVGAVRERLVPHV